MNRTTACLAVLASLLLGAVAAAADKPAPPKREAGAAGGWPEIQQISVDRPAESVKEKLMLVSWGDVIVFYGPDTDDGLYNRRQIDRMMQYWKDKGFTQVYWRAEDDFFMKDWKWNLASVAAEGSLIHREGRKIHESEDTTRAALEAARRLGMKFFLWHSIFDEGSPPDKHRTWKEFPWRHTDFDKHREWEQVDRKGDVQWGVPEFWYPEVRQRKIDQYLAFVRRYPVDGVFVYLHTHSERPFRADQYGFNKAIVDEYQKRYNIDILTDPRFDCFSPDFKIDDPAVEKWRELRGESLTLFLRELKDALRKENPKIQIAINTQGGDYIGPPFGNMKIEWRTWVKEGLVDVMILRTWMAGSAGAYDFGKEGYLTWGDGGIGRIPYEQFKAEIRKSGHNVLVISRERTHMPGADGYYDSSNRDTSHPKTQRAQQFDINYARDGHIGWIEQDFENQLPLEENGLLDFKTGSQRYYIGDYRYSAVRNSSPGLCGPFTSDPAQTPALLDASKVGGKGTAALLSAAGGPLTVTRRTGRDWPEESITSGKVSLAFDVCRAASGGLNMDLPIYKAPAGGAAAKSDANEALRRAGFGIRIRADGALQYNDSGTWKAGAVKVPDEAWSTVQMELDFAAGTYTVALNGQAVTSGPVPFDARIASVDSLSFRCSAGEAWVDGLKVLWMPKK